MFTLYYNSLQVNHHQILMFIPPWEIASSIIASLSIILFLLVFSHRPFKIQAGRRYMAACFTSAFLWIILLLKFNFEATIEKLALTNMIAGVLIFIASILTIFPFYSVLSWGFRIAMLIRLDEQSLPISLETWMRAYSNGGDMHVFYQDRMRTLYRFGMAVLENNQLKLTPIVGKSFGILAKFLYSILSIGKEEMQ